MGCASSAPAPAPVSITAIAAKLDAPPSAIVDDRSEAEPAPAPAAACIKSAPCAAALTDDAKAVASVAAFARSPNGSLTDLPLSLVAGRVCRGASEDAFETLHSDGLFIHPIVFVTGQ